MRIRPFLGSMRERARERLGFQSIRTRLLLTFGVLLALGALNIGVYYWAGVRRGEVFQELRRAIDRQAILIEALNLIEDQKKFIDLLTGVFGVEGSAPPSEEERRKFFADVDRIEEQLATMLPLTSAEGRSEAEALVAKSEALAASWKSFYSNQWTDLPKAISELYLHAEPLAAELINTDLPQAIEREREQVDYTRAMFVQTDATSSRVALISFIFSLLLGGFLAIGTSRELLAGITNLKVGADRIGSGAMDYRIPVRARDELGDVAESFNRMVVELQARDAELVVARDKAEEASRTKSMFLANMSHELRTPLNAILGYSEMLMEDATDLGFEDQVPDLQKIHTAGTHLLALINDILDLSKIEAGKMELHLESFEVCPLVDGVVTTVRPLVERNENLLRVDCRPDVGSIRADITRVRQILFNLLSNASKFTQKGTVSLDVFRERTPETEWVVFRVCDTGIGISKDQLGRLFQAFEQADASVTRKYGGTGLGLVISRRFAHMLHGDIEVESAEGVGSTFTVRLPARGAAAAVRPEPAVAGSSDRKPGMTAAAAQAPSGHGLVLVIDDDPGWCDYMRRVLEKEGLRIEAATSGAEGLRLARELKPSVITLDLLMPRMDGWAVLKALHEDEELASIPVILVTTLGHDEMGLALGASEYIPKPLDRDRLITALRRHLRPEASSVLVVEDDDTLREMMRRVLEREGCYVVQAENGRVALERIREVLPDLILLDLLMPEMDGFEFLGEMQKDERWRSVPVVVITAKDITAEDQRKLAGHVQRILLKGDYAREELITLIRRLLPTVTASA